MKGYGKYVVIQDPSTFLIHGMLLKGFFRNLGGPVSSSVKGYLEPRQRGFEDEVQVVGSIHSTKEAG